MLPVEKGNRAVRYLLRINKTYSAQKIYCARYSLLLACLRTNPLRRPLPDLRKEVNDVIEIRLTCRGINDGLKRDTEKGKGKKENEEPEDESKHSRYIIQQE